MRRASAFFALPFAAIAVAGCGTTKLVQTPPAITTGASSAAGGSVRISSGTIPGLGTVLLDSHGNPLYVFTHDHGTVTCAGECAAIWPPVLLASGQTPVAGGQVQGSMLGTEPGPAGARVVTYAGKPLYAYSGDTAPGHAQGETLNMDGGLFYAIAPSGLAD